MKLFPRLLGTSLIAVFSAAAQNPKVAPDAGITRNVIVQYAAEPDSQTDSRMAALGGKKKHYLSALKAAVYEIPGTGCKASRTSGLWFT